MPGILNNLGQNAQAMQPNAMPQQPNALQQYFTPERTAAFQGLGNVLQGGTGQQQLRDLLALQQQQALPQQAAPVPRPKPPMNAGQFGFLSPMVGMPQRPI